MSTSKNNYNIFDYVEWRCDLPLKKEKLNYIDLAIFSQLSLIDFDTLFENDESYTINTLSKLYFSNKNTKKTQLGLIIPKDILKLLKEIKSCNRYKELIVSDYVNIISIEHEEQMSALTVSNADFVVVVFSGTDDTVIGWKENFNLIYKSPTSAQVSATKYLENIANKYMNKKIYVCGHSKGGNLAMYSCINVCENIQKRISKVVSFDGPGLNEEESKKLENTCLYDDIISIMPSSSCIGRLFCHTEKIKVVKSYNNGFYQHDVFSWYVNVDKFVYEDKLSEESTKFNNKVNEVLTNMNFNQRENLVNNIYKVLSNAKLENLVSFNEKKFKVIDAYMHLSKEEKQSIYLPFKELLKEKTVRKILFDSLKENINGTLKGAHK